MKLKHLLLRRKAMTNQTAYWKAETLTLATKFCLISYGFSSSHVWMWELDYKESWVPKNWCFLTVVLEKTLESPLDSKEIQPVNPKGNQSWIFTGRTDTEAEALILWPHDAKNWLIWKDPDAGKNWRREEKGTTEDEMVGWHHRCDGHEFDQASGVGARQGSLACCSPWGHKDGHNWATELNWGRVRVSPWDFPGKNTGVSCHFLLQGIFLTQGLNPCLLHWQADSLPLSHQGSPCIFYQYFFKAFSWDKVQLLPSSQFGPLQPHQLHLHFLLAVCTCCSLCLQCSSTNSLLACHVASAMSDFLQPYGQ